MLLKDVKGGKLEIGNTFPTTPKKLQPILKPAGKLSSDQPVTIYGGSPKVPHGPPPPCVLWQESHFLQSLQLSCAGLADIYKYGFHVPDWRLHICLLKKRQVLLLHLRMRRAVRSTCKLATHHIVISKTHLRHNESSS